MKTLGIPWSILLFLLIPIIVLGQNGEQYSVSNVSIVFGGKTAKPPGNTDESAVFTVGQPFVGVQSNRANNGSHSVSLGIWSFYLKQPDAPFVHASAGDYNDRITIDWFWGILSPPVNADATSVQYKLYKGNNLSPLYDTKDEYEKLYTDEAILPGQFYEYSVEGFNKRFGVSEKGISTGFANATATVYGTVKTPEFMGRPGRPVPDVEIRVTPFEGGSDFIGTSVKFDGDDDYLKAKYKSSLNLDSVFTVEGWIYLNDIQGYKTIFDRSLDLSNSFRLGVNSDKLTFRYGNEVILADSAKLEAAKWAHVAVIYDGINLKLYVDSVLTKSAPLSPITFPRADLFFGKDRDGNFYEGLMDEFRIWDYAKSEEELFKYMNNTVSPKASGLTAYWKFDEGSYSLAFDWTTNKSNAELIGAEWNHNPAPVYVSSFTDEKGYYEIKGIYYDYNEGTSYIVKPQKKNHPLFEPQEEQVLFSGSNNQNKIDFIDRSEITLSGRIVFEDTQCPVDSAELLYSIIEDGDQNVDTLSWIPKVFTDEDGMFFTSFLPETTGRLYIKYKDHFIRYKTEYGEANYFEFQNLTNPISDIKFIDKTKFDLTIHAKGGKDKYSIGKFEVKYAGRSSGCSYPENVAWFVDTTDANGELTVTSLPPLNYEVMVKHLQYPDSIQIDNDVISLQDTSVTGEFLWYAPLEVEITGLDEYVKTDSKSGKSIKVISQFEEYPINITAFESYGNENKSYLDSGTVKIVDDVSGITVDTVMISNGHGMYKIVPFLPNFTTGGDFPYQNNITITVTDPEKDANAVAVEWLFTAGFGVGGVTFQTTSPAIPFLILHDPPGDKSYSFFSEEQSSTQSLRFYAESNLAINQWAILHLGSASSVSFELPFGPGVGFDIEAKFDLSESLMMSADFVSTTELINTISTTEEFHTSMEDQVIGDGSDLYIGGAMNLLNGIVNVLSWDNTADTVYIYKHLMVAPRGFATTFMYTENAIINNVIPNLEATGDTASIHMWEQILQNNSDQKDRATFVKNLSFSSGSNYTFTEETSVTEIETFEWETSLQLDLGMASGLIVGGFGAEGGYNIKMRAAIGGSESVTEELKQSVGYFLSDDDETSYLNNKTDQFTVDVLTDPVYGTPVFEIKGGESSCPWEVGTVPRDGVQLTSDSYSAVDVMPGEDAVFTLHLGNTSQTQEDRRYWLRVVHGSNPLGALIKINGIPLEGPMEFDIPGELTNNSIDAVMTITRGPEAYDYEDIQLRLYTDCDDMHPAPFGHAFYDIRSFDAHFVPPCSEISIFEPGNNWVINKDSEDQLSILLTDYNRNDENLESIVLEYAVVNEGLGKTTGEAEKMKSGEERKIGRGEEEKKIVVGEVHWGMMSVVNGSGSEQVKDNGGEDWFPAITIDPDTLSDTRVRVTWRVSNIQDNRYKIRAKTECRLGQTGYTQELYGIIDRESPYKITAPQPADGFLDPGDQIVIEFNEPLKTLNAYEDSIVVINMSNEEKLPKTWSVQDNQIIINIEADNRFIENKHVQIYVNGVQDLAGNENNYPVEFSFMVDRNPLMWETGLIEYALYPSSDGIIPLRIINRGTQTYDFELIGLPEWMTAFPMKNNVTAAGSRMVDFQLNKYMNYGEYRTKVFASTLNGDEPLIFEIRVMADPPVWDVNIADFQYTMNITGELVINEEKSTDKFDMVSAFVGQECRGVARVRDVIFSDSLSKNLVMLTVYSEVQSGEKVELRVWDALEGVEYARTIQTFNFENDSKHGTVSLPIQLTATNEVFQRRAVPAGWSWISYNVEKEGAKIDEYLSPYMNLADGDLLKTIDGFIQYSPSSGWGGSMTDMDLTRGYLIHIANQNLLETYGSPVDPEYYPLTLIAGWNWIGYLPQFNLPIDYALSGFNFAQDDFIKSQQYYAFYVKDYGWLGSLTHMKPGEGYMLQSANAGEFTYPNEKPYGLAKSGAKPALTKQSLQDSVDWRVEPSEYQFNMTVTAQISIKDSLQQSENYVLGAFVDDVVRGVAEPTLIAGVPYFFMMVYDSIYSGSTVEFKFFDITTKEIKRFGEQIDFTSNKIVGTVSNPYIFSDVILGLWEEGFIPEVYSLSNNYPNPFNPETTVEFGLPEQANVRLTIYNILGEKIIELLNEEMNPGYYRLTWDGRDRFDSGVPSGIYFYRISTKNFTDVKKCVMMK
ncbi:MAG: T9SS type A sorting domain-containing protein [Melioribacteraceae bacterium]|nr:T9SS type A sorting domain-containing protein [Melioribacteraceae bacterium]